MNNKTKNDLFGWIENSETHTASFVEAMGKLFGFNCVGFIYNGQTAVFERQNTYYHVTDNGGELNVCTVNENDTVGIPFTSTLGPLNAGTIAYRVWKLITEGYGAIGWDWVMGEEGDFENDESMEGILAPMRKESALY